MHKVLSEILTIAEDVRGTAQATLLGMSDEQLAWTPSRNRWSSAMIAEHLVLSSNFFLDSFEKILREAPKGELVPLPYNWFERFGARVYLPDSKIRLPVPPGMEPKPPKDPRASVQSFLAAHARFEAIALEAPNRLIADQRIQFPIPLARPHLVPMLHALLMHERYHLRQVEALIEEPGFPKR